MFANLTGWHALLVLAVVLLIFGAAKLPALARSVGQSVRILRSETRSPDATAHPVDGSHPVAPETTVPVVRAEAPATATTTP